MNWHKANQQYLQDKKLSNEKWKDILFYKNKETLQMTSAYNMIMGKSYC